MSQKNTCPITLTANDTADVQSARFVVLTGGRVTIAGDGADAIGVSSTSYDQSEVAKGNGTKAIGVITNPGCQVEVIASGAIAAGAEIASSADGRAKVAAAGDAILGFAVNAVTAANVAIDVLFSPVGRQK